MTVEHVVEQLLRGIKSAGSTASTWEFQYEASASNEENES